MRKGESRMKGRKGGEKNQGEESKGKRKVKME